MPKKSWPRGADLVLLAWYAFATVLFGATVIGLGSCDCATWWPARLVAQIVLTVCAFFQINDAVVLWRKMVSEWQT